MATILRDWYGEGNLPEGHPPTVHVEIRTLWTATALELWIRSHPHWQGKHRYKCCDWAGRWAQFWGTLPLTAVSAEDVDRYVSARAQAISAASLNHERWGFRSFWLWAQSRKYVIDPPLRAWPRLKPSCRQLYLSLTQEEEDRLCEAFDHPQKELIAAWTHFGFDTGLRTGTLYRLEHPMVRGGKLHIPPEIWKQREWFSMVLTERTRGFIPPRSARSDLLFPGLLAHQQMGRVWAAAAKRAGLHPKLSPKHMRSTWVGRMFAKNYPLAEVMRVGGWHTVSVLLKHYYGEVSDARALEMLSGIQKRKGKA